MNNANLQLNGFLGADPKVINKNGRSLTLLRIATTDSYPVKDGEITKWIDKETIWHDVLVFSPITCKFANELKKSDKVEISCSLAYREFKDENSYKKREAIIIGNFIQKIDYNKQDRLFVRQLIDGVVEGLAS